MAAIMSRREAQQKVDSLYKDIYDIYRILKSREGRLDDKRVQILQYLERILGTVQNNPEYKEGIDKLDDDGYRAYAAMLTDLLKKIKNHGVRDRSLSGFGMMHSRDDLYAKTEPYFTAAHVKPEPVKNIPESAWEKYVQRDLFNEQIYIGPRPLSRTIELGTNYLIRIGDFFPAPYDAQRKAPSLNDMAPEYDQDRDGIKVEGLSNVNRIRRRASFTKLNNMQAEISRVATVTEFLSDGLEKMSETAPDGSHPGDTILACEQANSWGTPVQAWVIRFTVRDLLTDVRLIYHLFQEDEARKYIQKFKLSNDPKEKESYEKVLALFH